MDIYLKYNNLFYFQTHHIRHGSSEKCMAISKNKDKVVMEACDPKEKRQMWTMENYDPKKLANEIADE